MSPEQALTWWTRSIGNLSGKRENDVIAYAANVIVSTLPWRLHRRQIRSRVALDGVWSCVDQTGRSLSQEGAGANCRRCHFMITAAAANKQDRSGLDEDTPLVAMTSQPREANAKYW